MPIRFTQGEILRLLIHLNMSPAPKGSKTHCGIGKDGIFRQCYFHFLNRSSQLATGTAKKIAKQLGYANHESMKVFMDKYL